MNRLDKCEAYLSISDERVVNLDDIECGAAGDYTVKTDKGTEIQTNLVIRATGLSVNSEGYASSFGESLLLQILMFR